MTHDDDNDSRTETQEKRQKKRCISGEKSEQKQATKCQDQCREKVKKRINKQDPQPSDILTHQPDLIPRMSLMVAPIVAQNEADGHTEQTCLHWWENGRRNGSSKVTKVTL